ncbi:MAG: Fe-S-binding domain-containing protein, partial [Bacteroidota bacterium]
MLSEYILTITIFLPLLGGLALFLVNKENVKVIKLVGFGTTVLTFAVSLVLYFGFDPFEPGFQFQHKMVWIEHLSISY